MPKKVENIKETKAVIKEKIVKIDKHDGITIQFGDKSILITGDIQFINVVALLGEHNLKINLDNKIDNVFV